MTAARKTQAMRRATRALDARGIAYRTVTYDASGDFHSAEEAAALLGVASERVYKTLVVLRDAARARPLMVMAPAAAQLDLKLLAHALGEKRLRMATLREAERLTGMQAGGISALGLQRPSFDVLIDESARSLDALHVSAGARGIDLELRVVDLVAVTGARWVCATKAPAPQGAASQP
jgi:Cys-tRNA(Pro)/Cys-tRNA(Cys) deacylase